MFDEENNRVGRNPIKYSEKIVNHVYYFSEFPMLDCSMYIIEDATGDLLLVDTGNGMSFHPLLTALDKLHLDPKKIKEVLLTHEHVDHVLGLYIMFDKALGLTPKIYAHPVTASILKKADEKKIFPGELGITAAQFGINIVPLDAESLKAGDTHKFGSFSFQVLETLGHSLGSVSYYEPTLKILFPGDVVFPHGSFGRYDFPGGSLEKLKQSIKSLSELDVTYLCSGHMEPVDNGKRHILSSLKMINSMNC